VVNLYIHEDLGWPPHGQDEIRNNTQWLAFLRLFTAVENLITHSEICTMHRARYARAVGVRMTEVLPALQNI
jgi:hypothetical protein